MVRERGEEGGRRRGRRNKKEDGSGRVESRRGRRGFSLPNHKT